RGQSSFSSSFLILLLHRLKHLSQQEWPERRSVGVEFHSLTRHYSQVWSTNVHVGKYYSTDRPDALRRRFLFLAWLRKCFRNFDFSIASLGEQEIDYFEEGSEHPDLFLVFYDFLLEIGFQLCQFLCRPLS